MVLFTGCATGPTFEKTVVDFKPLHEKEFSKRPPPARIGSDSDESLKESGYFLIGTLAVDLNKEVCWASSSSCTTFEHDRKPNDLLLKEASEKGGDLVVLRKQNRTDTRKIEKKGACLRSKTECTQVWVTDYRQECTTDSSGFVNCRQVASGGHTESNCVDVCQEWQIIRGTLKYMTSIATVWRHDPGMAEKIKALEAANRPRDIMAAIREGDTERFRELSKEGGDALIDNRKTDILLEAVKYQQYEIYQLTEPTAEESNFKDADGLTLLHHAVEQGNPKMSKLLVEHGADIDARNPSQNTPLHWAISKGRKNVQTIQWLLKNGADVNARDEYQYTPLHYAAMHRGAPVIELLLKHGADANARNYNGDTPLHKAARKADLRALQLLLAHGAEVQTTNKKGATPLNEAHKRTRNRRNVVEFLEKHGAGR